MHHNSRLKKNTVVLTRIITIGWLFNGDGDNDGDGKGVEGCSNDGGDDSAGGDGKGKVGCDGEVEDDDSD